jgi:hypothetical protein
MARGETNSKNFHLINWSIVRSPKDNSGLGIKDISLMNMLMGAKILCVSYMVSQSGGRMFWLSTFMVVGNSV